MGRKKALAPTRLTKPRDMNVVAMLKRASGVHGPSDKAIRRKEKQDIKRCVAQLAEQETFNLKVVGSIPAAPTTR